MEEINIKYIKDYLLVKRQLEVEEFSRSEAKVIGQPMEYFRSKYEAKRIELEAKIKKSHEELNYLPNETFVNHCTNLIKQFLLERQPHY